ncbi:MAG TPA: sialidase family protein [Candidatus Hydrogenedentes bacterium]|nr:sialidase family protein [Candidatus Hydrogenedentota bacterium]
MKHVCRASGLVAIVLLVCPAVLANEETFPVKHVKVYFEKGRFGGWPANHGIWSWGNEILVGFSRGYYKDMGPSRHHIDREKPEEHLLARSMDGGETWQIEDPAAQGYLIPQGKALHGAETPGVKIPELRDCPGNIHFTHPDFAMTVRMSSIDAGVSRFYYSYDRGHSWEGPFRLPNFDTPGVAARTDYLVGGDRDCMLFLTAAKRNGKEGRPFCARTRDGGATWDFVSWIGPEPAGYAIMPATVRLAPEELITVIRCREGDSSWLTAHVSRDNGQTWKEQGRPVESTGEGNPASLTLLDDGRLCLVYGYRAKPFSMRARISDDGGASWGKDIVLRDDGAGRDIGYPRSVQRPDGKMVSVYYFHDDATGPERYIAATIWDPAVCR